MTKELYEIVAEPKTIADMMAAIAILADEMEEAGFITAAEHLDFIHADLEFERLRLIAQSE